MKNKAIYLGAIVISLLYLFIGGAIASKDKQTFENIYNDQSKVAVVEGILTRTAAEMGIAGADYGRGVNITFAARIVSREDKGKLVTVLQNIDPDSPFNVREVTKGDKILIHNNKTPDTTIPWQLGEYVRTDFLLMLALIFAILLLVFGRMKGFNTLVSLGFSCWSIFGVFIPAILSGKNIYLWATLTCLFMVISTMVIVNGISKKSFCAITGCIFGMIAAGVLTLVSDKFLRLTGLIDEESLYLKSLLTDSVIDLKAIIFATILIGAVGAIMDVAISMSTSLCEISQAAEKPTFGFLMSSGISMGRDIMGTMANTLVLAYIGGSLSLTLLLIAYSTSTITLLNREMIVVEILRAIIGSFGLLLTIPFTSAVGAYIFQVKHVNNFTIDGGATEK